MAGLSGTGNVSSEEAWHMCMHKYTHTHIMQAGWKLFLDTQDLALADGMSQGIKLYVNTLRTQNKARDFLKEKLVQTIMQALLIQ